MTPSSSSAADSAGSSNAAAAGSGSAELPDAARLEWLWGEYEKQMEQIKQQQEEGMDIYPTMGFVAKTHLLRAPTRPVPGFPSLPRSMPPQPKLFLNVLSDPAISMPSLQTDASGQQGVRVPLSAGAVSLDVEKDGVTPCLAVDVVLNPDSVARAQGDRDFKAYLCGFVVQKLEEKYKIEIEQEIKFPKMRYKGPHPSPPSHFIRRPARAHVEEVRDSEGERGRSDAESMEERRNAAKMARIEALRRAEERESGVRLDAASAKAAPAADVFLSERAAAEAASVAFDDAKLAPKREAKIEVMSEEPASSPAAASSTSATAAASSSAASAAASASAGPAPTAANPASSSSSLPAHRLFYLKSLSSDATSGVPPAEWDLSLSLPAAVRVEVSLPLVAKSSVEMEVDMERAGVSLRSKQEWRHKHQYEMQIQLPFILDEESSSASWSKKLQTLTLTLPVIAQRDLDADSEPASGAAESSTTAATAGSSAAQPIDLQDMLALTNTLTWRSMLEA